MYKVVIKWQDGRETIPFQSYNSVEVREYAYHKVSRNPNVISRIEIHDSSCLETVWAAAWIHCH
jgi:hypothetical protein